MSSHRLEEAIADLFDHGRVPGVSVALTTANGTEYASFGTICHGSALPVDHHTQFLAGSITKTFTATLIAQLHEQGRLNIDAPVTDYMPDFELSDPTQSGQVLVRHLVQHQGGWVGDADMRKGWESGALEGHLKTLRQQPMQFAPGSHFAYSNSGATVAGLLAQRVTGEPYENLVTERLLAPLGMNDSVLLPDQADRKRLARGHELEDGQLQLLQSWGIERDQGPAGSLISTAQDLALWARFHLDGSCDQGRSPLSNDARLAMRKPLTVRTLDGRVPGFGWSMGRTRGSQFLGHSGNIAGAYLSVLRIFPELDAGIVVLTNSWFGGALATSIIDCVLERVFGRPEDSPLTRDTSVDAHDFAGDYGIFQVRATSQNTLLIRDLSWADAAEQEVFLVSPDEFASSSAPTQVCGGFSHEAGGHRWLHHQSRMYLRD